MIKAKGNQPQTLGARNQTLDNQLQNCNKIKTFKQRLIQHSFTYFWIVKFRKMIIRIVKMGFEPGQIKAFLEVFEDNKDKIKGFEGCTHVELLRDVQQSNQFFTYSHWESEKHLNNYRNSALFKGVWENTKSKFNQKPEAWSTILNSEVV